MHEYKKEEKKYYTIGKTISDFRQHRLFVLGFTESRL